MLKKTRMGRLALFITITLILAIPVIIILHGRPAEEKKELEVVTSSNLFEGYTLQNINHKEIKLDFKDVGVKTTKTPPKIEEYETIERVLAPQLVSYTKSEEIANKPTQGLSSVRTMSFKLNDGTYQTGQQIIDYVTGNHNGKLLYDAFLAAHGQEVADKAAISLFYENGRLDPLFRGVCNPIHAEGGDTYRCVYADVNIDGGMDAGIKSINVWWQRWKIKEMANGSITCDLTNSETAKSYHDPCTRQYVDWLHNPKNSTALALRIYQESGNSFSQWVGYKRAFNKH